MTDTCLILATAGPAAFGWFFFVAFLVFLILRWRHMSPFRLSTPGIAFCTYLFLLLLPALFLASQQVDQLAAYRYIIANVVAGVGMIIGMLVAGVVFPAPRIDSRQYVRAPLLMPTREAWFSTIILLAVAVFIGATVVRFAMTGRIPIMDMFRNMHQYSELQAARFEMKKIGLHAGLFTRLQLYYINWSIWVIAPIVAIALQAKHQATQQSVWRFCFYAWIMFSIFLAMWDIHKISAAMMVSIIVAGTILIRGKLSWKLILVSCPVLLTPIMMSVIIHPENISLSSIVDAMIGRAFVAPSGLTYIYIELIPRQIPHTWGAGTYVLGSLIGRGTINVANRVATIVLGDMHTTVNMNCGFIGAGWAEAGYLGVVVYSLMAGFVSQLIYNYIMRQSLDGKKLHMVALQAIQIPMWTIVFASVNFTELFAGRGLVFAFVLCWWLGSRLYDPAVVHMHDPYERQTPEDDSSLKTHYAYPEYPQNPIR